jgi:NAD-dependent dihydropyrimidine dehydrogenase PreA subunit
MNKRGASFVPRFSCCGLQKRQIIPSDRFGALALDQADSCENRRQAPVAAFLFTCPRTNLKVQHWLDDGEDVPATEYEAVQCQDCARLHLINRKTGKLLGEKDSTASGGAAL